MLESTVMRYAVTGTTVAGMRVTYKDLRSRAEANVHVRLHTWAGRPKIRMYTRTVGTHAFL